MRVHIHPHARERMQERGADEEEIMATLERGEQFKARFGRVGFRPNFPFNKERRGRLFATKQVELYAIQENDAWVVITVLTRFF